MALALVLFAMLLPTSLLASTHFPDSDEALLESMGPSQVVAGSIWTSEIAADSSCQVMQAQGYDERVWAPILWAWGWTTRIVKGATHLVLLLGLGCDPTEVGEGEAEKESHLPLWKRILRVVVVSVIFIVVIVQCYYQGVLSYCADLCSSVCFQLLCLVMLMFVPLALGILGSILTLLLILVLFPLAQKLKWYSMQNAILVCMPWPNGYYVAIGTFVLPLYAAKMAWSIKQMFDPPELLPSQSTKLFLMLSVYFSTSTLISAVGTQPWWFFLLWSLTLAGELKLLPSALQTEDEDAYQKLVHWRLRVKNLPQAVLLVVRIVIASSASGANASHSSIDQYQLYSITTTFVDILQTMIRHRDQWYTSGREPLDTSLTCPLAVE